MAGTRRNIPLVVGFSETAQIHDIEPFQVKLGVLYNQGVRVINQSDELLDRYWALPQIETRNGSVKGKDPLQACYILKIALDNLAPDYLVNQAAAIQAVANQLPRGGRGVGFQNGSILLGQEALYEIFYAYIQSNLALFSKSDLSFLAPAWDVPYFQAFLSRDATAPFFNDPNLFFVCLHQLLVKDQSNVKDAYLEFAKLVYPNQMPKNEMPSTTAGQAPGLLSIQASSFFAPASGKQETEEKKSSLSF